MKYLKTFEKYHPLEGICGIEINNKWYKFHIGKLVNWCKKNYKTTIINTKDVSSISSWVNIENRKKPKPSKNSVIYIKKIDNRLTIIEEPINNINKNYEISEKDWEDFKKEQLEIIKNTDLKYPIIVAVNNENKITSILDGNHRVEKARMLNIKDINAYKIPEKDILISIKNKELETEK